MKTEEEVLIEAEEWAKKEKENRLFGQQVNISRNTDDFQTEAYIAGYKACENEIMSNYILISKDYDHIHPFGTLR